jgi:thioredoxin-related protein
MVDGLERTLEGRAQVIRLNISSDVGRRMAALHHVRVLPTFVVFDGRGNAVSHHGGLVKQARLLNDIHPLLNEEESN